MAKQWTKDVAVGTVFSLKKNKNNYYCKKTGAPIKLVSGSELVVRSEPYTENGLAYIDFSLKGDTKQYTTDWHTFRDSTKLKAKRRTPKKKEIVVTSTGPFHGFDIIVRKASFEEYKYLHFSALKVIVAFNGTLSRRSRLTPMLIDDIKNSPGFADKLKKLLTKELNDRRFQVEHALRDYGPQKLDDFTKEYDGAKVETRYKSGRVAFVIYLTADYRVIRENVKKQVDRFVQTETKRFTILNKR